MLLVQQLSALPSWWWVLLLIPAFWLASRHPLGFIGVFLLGGVLWASLRADLILRDELPLALEGQDITVEGMIADLPRTTEFGWRTVFEVQRATREDQTVTIPRRILLSVGNSHPKPSTGEHWRYTVRLRRPHGFQNPGGFDYEAHLLRNRIRARGYVRDTPGPTRLSPAGAAYAVNQLREHIGTRMRGLIGSDDQASVVVALANGDTGAVTGAQWEIYRRTGTLHLVAISGLHISLVAGIAFFFMRWLWSLPATTLLRVPAPVAGAVGGLLAASVYAALAGFVIPTQRALLMLAVALGAVVLRRRYSASQLLAAAMLGVLLFDPLSVGAAGFWLSFSAVAVIIYIVHGEGGRASWWRKWGYLQWAIAIGLAPLTLALFQQVSLVAPVANLIAVPLFDLLAVPLTLIGLATLEWLPDVIPGTCFRAAAWLLAQLWPLLEWLASQDFAIWTQPTPPAWALGFAVVGTALLLAPRGWPARWLGVVWLTPMLVVRAPAPATGEVWLTLLDVGQGLAAVVRTQRHTMVFDTGPRFSSDFDAGSAVIVPYLRHVGVDRINTLVVSHGDNDHIGGTESLRSEMAVDEILSSVPDRIDGAHTCAAGQQWAHDGVTFEMLNPRPEEASRHNNASCVMRIAGAHGAILLTGDIEARTERRLVREHGAQIGADVLVVPHHGSKTSSSDGFLRTVNPRWALLPVGYGNRFRHPHPSVLARYAKYGIEVDDTASAGALEIRLDAQGVERSRYRERARRYWFSGTARAQP